VVIYNYFTRKILGLKAMVSDISAGVMRLVSRDLDRGMTLNIVTPTIPSARVAE
jgi:biopolymer transport protein ExbB